MKPLVIYGAAGHAKTVIAAAECAGREVAEVICDNPHVTTLYGVPVRSPDASLYLGGDYQFIVAIGSNAEPLPGPTSWLLDKGARLSPLLRGPFPAPHLRKELESTRNVGDTPAMTLVADDVGRLAGREWFPPQTGFEAQPDEHGHRPGLAL
jgi:hypothetical protein